LTEAARLLYRPDSVSDKPTEDQVIRWFDELSNWGRWGREDVLGTLNLITPEKRAAAARLAREGLVVSCGRTISYEHSSDAPDPPRHFMLRTGLTPPEPGSYGRGSMGDHFTFTPHGITVTHLDAPSHSVWRSRPEGPRTMYNGHPDTAVTMDGATIGSIELAGDGIVTRGVLLDIAGLHGVDWLEPGTPIFPEDLDAAEQRQGVRVEPGDALMVRNGHLARRNRLGPTGPRDTRAGLQAACLPWLRQRDVALLSSDSAQDVGPYDYPNLGYPIHGVGMVAMGLWLLDNADTEPLVEACRRLGRWEFLFTVAPLKWQAGTASPVNPLAMF
jgi:kynurenine formamidase